MTPQTFAEKAGSSNKAQSPTNRPARLSIFDGKTFGQSAFLFPANPLIQDVDMNIPPPSISTTDGDTASTSSAVTAKDDKYDANEEDEVDWDDSPLT